MSEYLTLPESLRPTELVYGVVREPPAPLYGHQSLVTRLGALLYAHAREHDAGEVCVSPVDVVLDAAKALVVQPDIVFVARARRHIIDGRIWGAPDLVVEVLSRGTAVRDRTIKAGWYAEYGVRECWLVDRQAAAIDVIGTGASEPRARFTGNAPILSAVLPLWRLPARAIFE